LYKAWRSKNLDHARKWARDYQKKNPEKILAAVKNQKHKRRSLAAISAGVSRTEWSAIREAFDNRCAYCLRQLDRLEMDHVTALSRGGAHDPDNIVPACRSCNAIKSNRGILMMLRRVA
jgi:5-methylcytosine-specific restriction endonuclease McrA